MTVPLVILAASAVLLGFLGTPAWPWFQAFLNRTDFAAPGFSAMLEPAVLTVMLTSTAVVFVGLFLGWWLYSRTPIASAETPDILDRTSPALFTFLGHAYYVDALYAATLVRLNNIFARLSDLFDRFIFGGAVRLVSYSVLAVAWFDSFFDSYFINAGFDAGTHTVSLGGRIFSRLQTGRVQTYLRLIGLARIVLGLYLRWGASA